MNQVDNKDVNPSCGRNPDFLFIGGPKCGSTWLYEALRTHPEVFVPTCKGVNFFDQNFDRGLGWYLSHFTDCQEARVVGEISHDTYAHNLAARRIRRYFPDIKLILCLREPGDFARSVLRWWNTHTNIVGSTIEEMVLSAHYRSLLQFQKNLGEFRQHFDPSQILVVFFEDLKRDPKTFAQSVYKYLEIDPDHKPVCLNKVVNLTREPRFPALVKLSYKLGVVARRNGAGAIVELIKSFPPFDGLLYHSEPQMTDDPRLVEAAIKARQTAQQEYTLIEDWIGRSLPAEWINPVRLK